ncbi:uncharacterized protein PAC_00512 [Phialocephala subalpina]|uniref:Uncharacterized protein n=1 Tax=Phialocephala subalpina TaxID=576137 RepID=A0A1L7WD33_9HELO|nr:uncharacterized protein PAC_00512 [Phialocephala subalpina]
MDDPSEAYRAIGTEEGYVNCSEMDCADTWRYWEAVGESRGVDKSTTNTIKATPGETEDGQSHYPDSLVPKLKAHDTALTPPSANSYLPSTNKRNTPNRLDSYVRLTPFLPYLDKRNEHLQDLEYTFNKPDDKWIDLEVIKN